MCCRYLLTVEALRAFAERHGLEVPAGFVTRYNLAPSADVPVLRKKPGAAKPELALMRWGLVPAWATSGKVRPQPNARVETAATKPAFREAAAHRRCLIPASGFYEWQAVGKKRKPFLFRRRDGRPICLGGLWEPAPDGPENPPATCAVITTQPGELMRPIHTRQPLVVADLHLDRWLAPGPVADGFESVMTPLESGEFEAVALDDRVNQVRNDDIACLAPAGPEQAPQLSLEL